MFNSYINHFSCGCLCCCFSVLFDGLGRLLKLLYLESLHMPAAVSLGREATATPEDRVALFFWQEFEVI